MKMPALTQNQAGTSEDFNTNNYNPVERFLHRLTKVKSTGSDRWIACCPAHEDRNPSLSIRECSDGTVLLKCWAGCTARDITAAIGLELRDLFPPKPFLGHYPRDGLTTSKRREYRALLEQEDHLLRFARAATKCGETLSSDDAERVLLADERVRKLRRALHV